MGEDVDVAAATAVVAVEEGAGERMAAASTVGEDVEETADSEMARGAKVGVAGLDVEVTSEDIEERAGEGVAVAVAVAGVVAGEEVEVAVSAAACRRFRSLLHLEHRLSVLGFPKKPHPVEHKTGPDGEGRTD